MATLGVAGTVVVVAAGVVGGAAACLPPLADTELVPHPAASRAVTERPATAVAASLGARQRRSLLGEPCPLEFLRASTVPTSEWSWVKVRTRRGKEIENDESVSPL
jgi:hypothetical protein